MFNRLLLIACLWALSLPAVAQPAASPARPALRPLADFAALPFIARPELSPDGTKVAARLSIRGKQQLAILQIVGTERAPTIIGVGEYDLLWWRWVNDEWLAVGYGAERMLDAMPWYITRTVGIHVSGKMTGPFGQRTAGQHAADLIWAARDGSPRILLGMQKSVYSSNVAFWPEVNEIDLSTGAMRKVQASNWQVGNWYADTSGTVRVGVGYSDLEGVSRMLYRASASAPMRTVERVNTRADEEIVVPALFLADPGKALAFSNHEGFNWLYEYDLGKLEIGDRYFSVPGFDLDGIEADPSGMALASISYTDSRRRDHWVDPQLADLQAAIDKAIGPGLVARIVSMNRNQQRLFVHVGGADRPGAFYFMDRADGRLRRVAFVNEAMKMAALGPVRTIHYKARDGLEIAAVLTLPPGRMAKDLPLIVLPHGGPQVRDAESYDWWAQFLADRGYAVVQPNYRGSSGYGHAFKVKGEGQWGMAMQDDLLDAIDALAAQGIADPKRVCIAGASYGGYAALRGAQRDGAHYRCAISYAAVSDLPGILRYDSRFFYAETSRLYWKETAPDLNAVSPLRFPGQFTVPVLIIHGKVDRRVPVRQSRDMAAALAKAGKPVRYVEQPEGDHHFSRVADRQQFLEEMEAFLHLHNPP